MWLEGKAWRRGVGLRVAGGANATQQEPQVKTPELPSSLALSVLGAFSHTYSVSSS